MPYGSDTIVIPVILPAGLLRPRRSAYTGQRGQDGLPDVASRGGRVSVAPIPRRSDPALRLASSNDDPDERPHAVEIAPNQVEHHHHEQGGGGAPFPHTFEPLELPAWTLGGSDRPKPSPNNPSPAPSALRQNLIGTGRLATNDPRQAHHVVPRGGAMNGDRNPEPAQRRLQNFGISLESVENGLPLSPAFHQRLHTTNYYEYVNNRLRESRNSEEAYGILAELRNELARHNELFERTNEIADVEVAQS